VVSQLTSDAFLIAAFAAELGSGALLESAQARLDAVVLADGSAEGLAHIAKCARGALANLHAVPEAAAYTALHGGGQEAASEGEEAQTEAEEGLPQAVAEAGADAQAAAPASSTATTTATEQQQQQQQRALDARLRRAMRARTAHERQSQARRDAAASVLQRRQRHRLLTQPPRRSRSRSPVSPLDAEAARERLRQSAQDASTALLSDRADEKAFLAHVQPALLRLARHLTDVGAAEEVGTRAAFVFCLPPPLALSLSLCLCQALRVCLAPCVPCCGPCLPLSPAKRALLWAATSPAPFAFCRACPSSWAHVLPWASVAGASPPPHADSPAALAPRAIGAAPTMPRPSRAPSLSASLRALAAPLPPGVRRRTFSRSSRRAASSPPSSTCSSSRRSPRTSDSRTSASPCSSTSPTWEGLLSCTRTEDSS
jgi:hypothetical protein